MNGIWFKGKCYNSKELTLDNCGIIGAKNNWGYYLVIKNHDEVWLISPNKNEEKMLSSYNRAVVESLIEEKKWKIVTISEAIEYAKLK